MAAGQQPTYKVVSLLSTHFSITHPPQTKLGTKGSFGQLLRVKKKNALCRASQGKEKLNSLG